MSFREILYMSSMETILPHDSVQASLPPDLEGGMASLY